jgi:hypothetical protein
MSSSRAWLLLVALLMNPLAPASANVVTDWDETAVAIIQPRMVPPVGYRAMAIVHIAMFDAVNSIEPAYQPYHAQLPTVLDASKDAAAATAAGTALKKLVPEAASDIQAALTSYLAAIPDSDAKSNGIKLGETVATKILDARGNDGSSAPDAYRPVTTAGVYIPTALTVAPQWPELSPFTMTSPSQFRPRPPIALESEEWAKDYNEIKELGAKNSSKRSAQQSARAPDRHPKGDVRSRQRSVHGNDHRSGSGRHDRGHGCKVQICFLASGYRHSQR